MSTPKITSDDVAAFAATAINLPKPDADELRGQVNTLRERLKKHIDANPGFSLVKMLHAGSVAKGTALRTINDFDVAVYVKKDDAPVGQQLVHWMTERLRDAYKGLIDPNQVQPGVNCATISFKGSGIKVDVVPVLYDGAADDCGYLVPSDGQEPLLTSVRLHLDFVQARKKKAPNDYTQVVRFIKWWVREQHLADDNFRFKSFMVELLVARLLDDGVQLSDYVAALEAFFLDLVKNRMSERVYFTDNYSANDLPAPSSGPIEIFDPANPKNNVASRYTTSDRDRILVAAEAALDALSEAQYATTRAQAVECWQVVLGSKFKG